MLSKSILAPVTTAILQPDHVGKNLMVFQVCKATNRPGEVWLQLCLSSPGHQQRNDPQALFQGWNIVEHF